MKTTAKRTPSKRMLEGIVICLGGNCPGLFKDKSGRLFIQGKKVSAGLLKSARPPVGDTLVEVSGDFLRSLKKLS